MLLIPADSAGISVHPFWDSPVLAAAQSEEVRLHDVHVPEHLVIRGTPDDPSRLDDLQEATFVWFELLITSAYVGAASALTERAALRWLIWRSMLRAMVCSVSDTETSPSLSTIGGVSTLVTPYAADDDGGYFRWRAWAYYQAGALSLSTGPQSPTGVHIIR